MTEEKNIDKVIDFSNRDKGNPSQIEIKDNPNTFRGGTNPGNTTATNGSLRGVITIAVLLVLIAVFIFLYINRPNNGRIVAPEGYRIESNGNPPKLEKVK